MNRQFNLNFLKTGLLTLIVDKSRVGFQKYGVPLGGAMDVASAEMANWLVGNDVDSALLEINVVGPTIQFEQDCQIALTGADISPTLDGDAIEMFATVSVRKESILKFGKLQCQYRAYLAIRGIWEYSKWNDQDSPVIATSITGLNSIKINSSTELVEKRSNNRLTKSNKENLIRAMKGPEYNRLDTETKSLLITTKFALLPSSNRMGYRLLPELPPTRSSIISSGVVPGTLQLTEGGQPILLMKDGPTTGGYLRALNVISEDLSLLGQLKPGDSFKFILV